MVTTLLATISICS